MGTFEVCDLKETLPNFPDEVLEDWLLPYANQEGWPPAKDQVSTPEGRWRYLLSNRPLAELRRINWQEQNRHLSIHELHVEYQQICAAIVLGAVQGQVNLYSSSIKDLPQRFQSILDHLRAHGSLPKAPALLATPEGFRVLDGNHRLSAYFYASGYFNLPVDDEAMGKAASTQRIWVGSI